MSLGIQLGPLLGTPLGIPLETSLVVCKNTHPFKTSNSIIRADPTTDELNVSLKSHTFRPHFFGPTESKGKPHLEDQGEVTLDST
jgi:hypothetical protein